MADSESSVNTERILKFVGLPAALASAVALTWDKVTGLDLVPRLILTFILAGIAQDILARMLAPDKSTNPVGFHTPEAPPRKSFFERKYVAGVILFISAALAFGLAKLQIERLVVSIERAHDEGSQALRIKASAVEAKRISIPLPPSPIECDIYEKGASLTEIDWEQPDRTLQIDRFVAPQTVSVVCETTSSLGLRGIEVEGPADGPFFTNQLIKLSFISGCIGLILWMFGLIRLKMLSR